MWSYIKIFGESFKQAVQSLATNRLRTALSLLGIMIGIFSIIAVLSAVDSMEANIKNGFKELGSDVIYVERMPWNEDPNQNYWKYKKRPEPSYRDYEYINKKSKLAEFANYAIFTGARDLKYDGNSIDDGFVMGVTHDYNKLNTAKIERGRYFTELEDSKGRNSVILGSTIAKGLFGIKDPIGEKIKVFGQSFKVIGVLEAEGQNMFNFINFDEVVWMSYNTIIKYVDDDPNKVGQMLSIKGKEDISLDDLKSELTGLLRATRRLKPLSDNNFALNEVSMLDQVIGSVFVVLNWVGFWIGIFALIVGMFSVANIMFVSVKERTGIIGVKKALGATRAIILSEFLIESVILCIIGGLLGLLLVFGLIQIITSVSPLEFSLSPTNVAIGILSSVAVGVIAGIIPALMAAHMDPVEAIRQ